MNRYDKLEWLEQTTSPQFMQETLVQEMVRWMGEDEFEQFYDHLCRMWDIARDPADLKYRMGEEDEEEQSEAVYVSKTSQFPGLF
jgi:hypothetical protein